MYPVMAVCEPGLHSIQHESRDNPNVAFHERRQSVVKNRHEHEGQYDYEVCSKQFLHNI